MPPILRGPVENVKEGGIPAGDAAPTQQSDASQPHLPRGKDHCESASFSKTVNQETHDFVCVAPHQDRSARTMSHSKLLVPVFSTP